VSLAAIFGLGVGITASWVTAGQFYAGYLTEYSLSLDNLFIFYVIMGWFAVPATRQHRVLLLGIGLALVLRSVLIVAGAAALNRFGWLFYPLGGILVWTAIGLITGRQDSTPERQGRMMSWLQRRPGRRPRSRQPPGRTSAGHSDAAAGRGDRAGRCAELALAISQFFTSRDAGTDGNVAFGHL
jgi:predicted tellurium resistance membrane protein TerC